jgi:hypothetical protein
VSEEQGTTIVEALWRLQAQMAQQLLLLEAIKQAVEKKP